MIELLPCCSLLLMAIPVVVLLFGERLSRRPKRTAVGAAIILATLVALFVTYILVNAHLGRKAVASWKGFAEQVGLEHNGEDSWEDQRVEGRVEGRRVVLWAAGSSSSTSSSFGRSQTTTSPGRQSIEIEVRGIPAKLSIRRGERLGPQVAITGDEAFDAQMIVICKDQEGARAWLDEDRRQGLLKFLRDEHQLHEGIVTQSVWGADLGELLAIYEGMRRLVEAIETPDAPPSATSNEAGGD